MIFKGRNIQGESDRIKVGLKDNSIIFRVSENKPGGWAPSRPRLRVVQRIYYVIATLKLLVYTFENFFCISIYM